MKCVDDEIRLLTSGVPGLEFFLPEPNIFSYLGKALGKILGHPGFYLITVGNDKGDNPGLEYQRIHKESLVYQNDGFCLILIQIRI